MKIACLSGKGGAGKTLVAVNLIADLPQTPRLHLVDAEFARRPEPVFYAPQDAVHIVLVALKLDDGVDYMLENFRSGEGTLLIDMSDEDYRHTARLGKTE